MKFLQPSFEIWQQEAGIDGIYRMIERAGRVCYKSENHVDNQSARPFVERLIASKHTAMLEHGTVYLVTDQAKLAERYIQNPFSVVHTFNTKNYITTNLRVLVEQGWMDDLQYLYKQQPQHEQRITVHFTTQVSITREFNRHRSHSMAEQSTRYCNYSKDKFGGEININVPEWITNCEKFSATEQVGNFNMQFINYCRSIADSNGNTNWTDFDAWLFANLAAEFSYMQLIALGRKPQEARAVLPLDVNTELIHTAFLHDWQHFFNLRALGTTGAPHPDAKAIAQPLYEVFKQNGWL
ncbi:FAD-dependent thymidylate synthase [Segatella oulorum]|uniref:FAD-dependent thymidylate synthase n=1 Tax=Segatella oulorum TaxID=28136 RepID=UPI0028EC4A5B|nr:FAD-dependent thymidylate synthase [Segatella oulorum]